MSKRPLESYRYHTVYLSYEEGPSGRSYVGKHSTDDPYDDYFGSFHDSSFLPVGKYILSVYKTPKAATQGEIMWQRVLNVVEDPHYINRAYQTSSKFDTTGRKRPPEETAPGGLAMKGMFFWINGSEQVRAKVSPGEGWVRGKLLDTLEGHRGDPTGTFWWFNPKTRKHKRSKVCPGNDWVQKREKILINGQLWQCLKTGHVSTAGPLSRYQKARGIDHKDPNNRRRIS